MGTLGPLYYVAMKCRDGTTRRRAVNLLLQSPRREGMWDGCVVGQFAQHIVAVEEANVTPSPTGGDITCDQVPESARFSDVTLGFTEDFSRGRIYLGRFQHESNGNWIVHQSEFDFCQTQWLDRTQKRAQLNPELFAPPAAKPELKFSFEVSQKASYESPGLLPRKSVSLNSYPTPGAAELEAAQRQYVASQMEQAGQRYRDRGSSEEATGPTSLPPRTSISYTDGLSQQAKQRANPGSEELLSALIDFQEVPLGNVDEAGFEDVIAQGSGTPFTTTTVEPAASYDPFSGSTPISEAAESGIPDTPMPASSRA